MDQNLDEYMTANQFFNWAKVNMNIIKPNSEINEDDICRVIRRIGMCAVDTIYIDGDKPKLGRIGIGLILSVTLMVFPDLYVKWGLSQPN